MNSTQGRCSPHGGKGSTGYILLACNLKGEELSPSRHPCFKPQGDCGSWTIHRGKTLDLAPPLFKTLTWIPNIHQQHGMKNCNQSHGGHAFTSAPAALSCSLLTSNLPIWETSAFTIPDPPQPHLPSGSTAGFSKGLSEVPPLHLQPPIHFHAPHPGTNTLVKM